MAVQLGTPLADALQKTLQAKLEEAGWSSRGDDSGLADFILLLVVNGKTQQEIAQEVQDFELEGSTEQSANDFARWLLEQVQVLSNHFNQPASVDPAPQSAPQDQVLSAVSMGEVEAGEDAAMDEDMLEGQQPGAVPTGPKSMRNPQKTRDRRMLGQLNSAMDRQHRIKGTAGTGRIGKDPPKGPAPKGPKALANGMQRMQQRQMNNAPMANMPMAQMNGMPGQMPFGMSPQDQMQAAGMFEQMSQFMAQFMPGQQQMFQNGGFANGHQQGGKSLFERVDKKGGHRKRQHQNHNNSKPEDTAMDAEPSDPASTVCKYNLFCTKPDCSFVHQSPAAPPETSIDMNDTCSFGAACKNKKCVGKHPSPAKKLAHAATQDCKFYPNCTNAHCPFNHPTAPPCRNGADCTVQGCEYSHNQVLCRFSPCTNPRCIFKHADGQKMGKPSSHVWIKNDGDDGAASENGSNHVSDRKFVDENAEEELIVPEQQDASTSSNAPVAAPVEGVVT